MSTEEELIQNVIRIKSASVEALTVAQVHAALVAEGVQVELASVKKAASKAAKRMPSAASAACHSGLYPPAAIPMASKKELKKEAAIADALKAAELAMMTAQKALHQESWMVALHGTQEETKAFIDRAAKLAISGGLSAGESVGKERVTADVATLQYLLTPGAPFELGEEEQAAAQAQLEKLERTKSVGSVASPNGAPFVAQPTFQGFRKGFVFKTGGLGTGYYHELWFAAALACYPVEEVEADDHEWYVAPKAEAPKDPELREILNTIDHKASSSLDRAMAKVSVLAAKNADANELDDID